MFPAATAVMVARNVARRGVTDGSTFPPGLPRSVGTSHVLLRCNQIQLRLSSSVKVFYDKTWAMNGV